MKRKRPNYSNKEIEIIKKVMQDHDDESVAKQADIAAHRIARDLPGTVRTPKSIVSKISRIKEKNKEKAVVKTNGKPEVKSFEPILDPDDVEIKFINGKNRVKVTLEIEASLISNIIYDSLVNKFGRV